jgi:hypothetical protein
MSLDDLRPSKQPKIEHFELGGYQYWSDIPHSSGITHPSTHLHFVDGVLYQFWPSTVYEKGGIWIRVPSFKRP